MCGTQFLARKTAYELSSMKIFALAAQLCVLGETPYCVVHRSSIWAHFCVFQSQCVHFVKASRLIMAVKGAIFHLYSINSEQPRVLDSSDVLPKLFQIFADCKTKLHKILFHTVWILLEQLLFFSFLKNSSQKVILHDQKIFTHDY